MKIVFGTVFAVLTYACAIQAQDVTSSVNNVDSNPTSRFSLLARPTFFLPLTVAAASAAYPPASPASFLVPPPPAPAPQPRPREARRQSDSFQLAVGYEYVHFHSALFNANLSGLHTSLTYYRKDWLGIEGSVVAAFGSSTFNNQSSKMALYTAGPRLAWREYKLQPWAHALAGGLHLFPQTALATNGFALQLGGGVDYLFRPLLSFRVKSDYIRSQLYSSGQNSFQVGAGFVFHF